jgi:putative membrane protein
MMYDGGFLFGMHPFWWIFWLIVIAVVVAALLRTSGSAQALRETPRETSHEVLRRRYAAGEVTTQEYEERKALLDRDVQAAKSGSSGH